MCVGNEVSYLPTLSIVRILQTVGLSGLWELTLSLIWVFRVPEVCFWLLFFLIFSLHLSSSHQRGPGSSGNCAVTARGNPGALLFACIPIKTHRSCDLFFPNFLCLANLTNTSVDYLVLHSRNILVRAFWKAGCFSPKDGILILSCTPKFNLELARMPEHRSFPLHCGGNIKHL